MDIHDETRAANRPTTNIKQENWNELMKPRIQLFDETAKRI